MATVRMDNGKYKVGENLPPCRKKPEGSQEAYYTCLETQPMQWINKLFKAGSKLESSVKNIKKVTMGCWKRPGIWGY